MSKDVLPSAENFSTVLSIIENAKNRALKAVNTELINMYTGKLVNTFLIYVLSLPLVTR